MSTLDSRAQEILDAVVRLNIETGRAVSSGLVERYVARSLSSASIRHIMKRLELEGYLEQPHPSAGRLPTDRGFRVFVDHLRSGWALRAREVPSGLRQEARRDLDRSLGDQDRIGIMARLLSRLTRNISIIVGPSLDQVRALRVELYPRSTERVLMVVILENNLVRTGMVTLPEPQRAAVVQQAARLISERIDGLSVGELRSGKLETVDLIPNPVSRCAAAIVKQGKDLFRDAEQGEVQLEGLATVLGEPEFSHTETLKALLNFIQSPAVIRQALGRLDEETAGEVGVWIGRENPLGELQRFSMLTGRFTMDGHQGMLAVLGPRRMWYQQVFMGIDTVQQVMNSVR